MKRGFALITVLSVAIMIALGAATILQSMSSHVSMKANNLQESRAQFLAEAGMQRALWTCRTNTVGCAVGETTCCAAEPAFSITINIAGAPVNIAVPIRVIHNIGDVPICKDCTDEIFVSVDYKEV
jgi:Tfp pilus assembly protein PilX